MNKFQHNDSYEILVRNTISIICYEIYNKTKQNSTNYHIAFT